MNSEIGDEIDSPALVVDLDIVEKNIRGMQKLANDNHKKLKPHAKTHKMPELAKLQVEAGAKGICVQKVGEAEVFARNGIHDILVSNEIIGPSKIRRIFDLANLGCDISLAVDSSLGIRQLQDIALEYRSEIDVLLDVDVGMHRCGVDPNDQALLDHVVNELVHCPRVNLKGLMGYDGHSGDILDKGQRIESVKLAFEDLMSVRDHLRSRGYKPEVISVGGTPSAELWAGFEDVTELQSGTYIFNDLLMVRLGVASVDDIAAYVVTQVMSKSKSRAIIDAGYKALAIPSGKFPAIRGNDGLAIGSMTEEHSVVIAKQGTLPEFEERLCLLPDEIPATVDLWDDAVCLKEGKVVGKLGVDARGKRA